MLNRIFLMGALFFVAGGLYADSALISISAAPVIGNLNYPKQKMLSFQVMNPGDYVIQAGASLANPFVDGAFENDKLLEGATFNPDIHNVVQMSPQQFVLAPHQSQSVRVFINAKTPLPVGDSVLGIYFQIVKARDMQSTPPPSVAASKLNMAVQVNMNQMSTVYVHNGKGKSTVQMSCNLTYPKDQPAMVNFAFKNTSVWMMRPSFSALQHGKPILTGASVTPMMGMTEGVRQLQLPDGTTAPLSVSWTSADGQKGELTCPVATVNSSP